MHIHIYNYIYVYIYIQYTQCAFEELLYIGVYFSVKQHLRRTYQSRRWTSSNMCGRNYHIIIQLSNIVCVLLFLGIQYVFEFVYSTGSISVMSNYYNEQWMETILHQLVDGLSHYCKAPCFTMFHSSQYYWFSRFCPSTRFLNISQCFPTNMSGFIIKMMIFFHQRLVSRPMFSDVGGSPAEARFFF